MPVAAVGTAMLACTFGMSPCTLAPIPNQVLIGGKPAATITDSTIANIPSFGMCTSLANPAVAGATAAAFGVLTPMPCTPMPTPWTPMAPTTLIGGKPVLTQGSQCICAFAGVIQVVQPAQFTTIIN